MDTTGGTTSTIGTTNSTGVNSEEHSNESSGTVPQEGSNAALLETVERIMEKMEQNTKAASSARLARLEQMQKFYTQRQTLVLDSLRKEEEAWEKEILKYLELREKRLIEQEKREKEREERLTQHDARRKERYELATKMIQDTTTKWEEEFAKVKMKEDQEVAENRKLMKEIIYTLCVTRTQSVRRDL
jgi:hypothetical protein